MFLVFTQRKIKQRVCLLLILSVGCIGFHQWFIQIQQKREQALLALQRQHLFQQHQKHYKHLVQTHKESHPYFEQSLLFRKTDVKKLEKIFHYLAQANHVVLEQLQIKKEVPSQPHFSLYTIDLNLKSLRDREMMALIRSLRLPNVIAVKKIHLERIAKLREIDVQHLIKQREKYPLFLVKAEMRVIWISWLDD